MNNELTAALTPASAPADDPAVLEQIAKTPYQVFVATIQRLAGNQVPQPGAPVLVRVKGVVRPIRLWMSQKGVVGADKPAVYATESFEDAREAVLAAQTPPADAV